MTKLSANAPSQMHCRRFCMSLSLLLWFHNMITCHCSLICTAYIMQQQRESLFYFLCSANNRRRCFPIVRPAVRCTSVNTYFARYCRPISLRIVDGQWRRQDLLRGGAKMKIMSWGTHGGLHRPVQ